MLSQVHPRRGDRTRRKSRYSGRDAMPEPTWGLASCMRCLTPSGVRVAIALRGLAAGRWAIGRRPASATFRPRNFIGLGRRPRRIQLPLSSARGHCVAGRPRASAALPGMLTAGGEPGGRGCGLLQPLPPCHALNHVYGRRPGNPTWRPKPLTSSLACCSRASSFFLLL